MTMRADWIPTLIALFFGKQRSYFARIVANKVAWGIPDAAIAPLLVLQAEYEPLYWKIEDKRTRTSADVTAHTDCRKRYTAAWRAFHKERVIANSLIPKSELSILVGKERDTKPTRRGKISGFPYMNLKAVGGGSIEFRAQVEKDATRPSMHPLADAVECRYTLVPKGEMPPDDPEAMPKTMESKKALFTIHCGVKNAGDSFWGFFRWVNLTTPENSGDWTRALQVVLS